MKRIIMTVVLCTLWPAAFRADTSANEVLVGPIAVSERVDGIAVALPVNSYVSLATKPDGLYLNSRVDIDLSDLQGKIGPIVDSFSFPTNNCASFSANNPVVRVWGKQLSVIGNALVLTLQGDVDLWDCRENPIQNSKIEWRNDGPFGLSIPHIVTWPGDPIKNRLINQPLTATLPVSLGVPNDQTIALQIGNPTINVGGQFGGVTAGVLRIAGIDLNSRAGDAIRQAVNPSTLRQGIPPDFAKLNPKIASATFRDNAGKPTVSAELSAAVPASDLTDFIRLLVNPKK